MNILERLKKGFVFFDGGTGTVLLQRGLEAGKSPEEWNITHPDEIQRLHESYFAAGADIIKTNTFGANRLKFDGRDGRFTTGQIVRAAVENAKIARNNAADGTQRFIALDIGPTGALQRPYGSTAFDEAVDIFADIVKEGHNCGVDLILCETFGDSLETKAAVLAAKENSNLPLFVTNAYDEKSKLLTGADPFAMTALLEGLGVDALGVNCSFGPDKTAEVVKELCFHSSIPVIANPNAGLPTVKDNTTQYDITPEEFARRMKSISESGALILGGCCGTTPEYIKALVNAAGKDMPKPRSGRNTTLVSSYTHALSLGEKPLMIGERINPTGKSKLKEALRSGNMEYILSEGLSQAELGAQILDVNVGLPDIDEAKAMKNAVECLQSVTDAVLQLDTSNPSAMENAMRHYNGKPLVNSVNGRDESMDSVFPLVKKYGGVVIALTLDENGIPESADGRLKIARRILERAAEYGISKKDIVFDALAMTVSSDNKSALVTLETVSRIKKELGALTSLGVSNISFGLPERDAVNSTFLALALENGLDLAIMNPKSQRMLGTYYAYLALHGLDEMCGEYIANADNFAVQPKEALHNAERADGEKTQSELQYAIVKGLSDKARVEAEKLISEGARPLDVINSHIIPALNIVGNGFEKNTLFLPQLLSSSRAAQSAFDIINEKLGKTGGSTHRFPFVIATVKGDIHDIGKNIVSSLLSNYGFEVIDLGKDVPAEEVAAAVKKYNAKIAGLSALMTTTVPSMEKTIKLLKKECPECRTVVGGAVMTQSYADMIGADKYAKNAMETVRYAESMEDNI